jgi:hypothetical protein
MLRARDLLIVNTLALGWADPVALVGSSLVYKGAPNVTVPPRLPTAPL